MHIHTLLRTLALAALPSTQSFNLAHQPRSGGAWNGGNALSQDMSSATSLQMASTETESSMRSKKVQDMASYLATKLLEKAVTEVAKEDGKSKMTEDDIMTLASALESISDTSPAEEPKSEASSKDTNVGSTLESGLEDIMEISQEALGLDTLVDPSTLSIPSAEEKSKVDAVETKPVEDSTKEELFRREMLSVRIQNDASKKETIVTETISIPQSTEEASSLDALEQDPVDNIGSDGATGMPRFPDVISKEFGKELEIVESDVPPLAKTGSPLGQPDLEAQFETSEFAQDNIPLDISSQAVLETESNEFLKLDSEATQSSTPQANAIDSGTFGDVAPTISSSEDGPSTISTPEERQSVGVDGFDANTGTFREEDYSSLPLEERAFAVVQDLGLLDAPIRINPPRPLSAPTLPEDTEELEAIEEVSVVETDNTGKPEEYEVEKLPSKEGRIPKMLRKISQEILPTIASSKESSKSDTKNTFVEGDYISLPLEERAYAIVQDLGLLQDAPVCVQQEPQPRAAMLVDNQQVSEPVAITEEPGSTTSHNEAPDPQQQPQPSSGRQVVSKVLQGISRSPRKVIQERVPANWKETISRVLSNPPSTRQRLAKAYQSNPWSNPTMVRSQPRSPSEEARLQAKYAGISTVEERAFAILQDLNMI